MLKIGEFSKLTRVSVKALRFYAEMGLLKPAWIDRFTGYRYYSLDQLPRLNRILALKDLGFSLEQIRGILRSDVPAAELHGMLRLRHAQLQQEMQEQQERLARVEARLRQMDLEGRVPANDVLVKRGEPLLVAGIRRTLPAYRDVGKLFGELERRLAQSPDRASPGPPLAIYFDREFREQKVDAEAAVPLLHALPAVEPVTVHTLPALPAMACLVHVGSYESIGRSYQSLALWLQAGGYRVAGPNREVYLRGPESDVEPDEYMTELQLPIQKTPPPGGPKESALEPKIVNKPAFTVVGMLYRGLPPSPGSPQNNEIGKMWQVFNQRVPEIKHRLADSPAYGICFALPDSPNGEFEYLAGFEVSNAGSVPSGMVSREVPATTYAAFPCTLDKLHETYEYAYDTWLPVSGYKLAKERPDFEYYGKEFDPQTDTGLMYVYVPIEK